MRTWNVYPDVGRPGEEKPERVNVNAENGMTAFATAAELVRNIMNDKTMPIVLLRVNPICPMGWLDPKDPDRYEK